MDNYRINFVGMERHFSNQSDVLFVWGRTAPQLEKGFENENNYSDISYRYPSEKGSVEHLGVSKGTKEEREPSSVQWLAFKQQVFSTMFVADRNFLNADMRYDTEPQGSGNLKKH